MNDELIISLGECAIALRESPQYQQMKVLFEQQIAHDLLTTGTKDNELREQLYHQLQGARAFHDHVDRFAEMLIKLTTPDQPVEQAQGQDDPGEIDLYDEN